MCKSKITLRKFVKLICEVEFYQLTIFSVFCLTGVENFTLKGFVVALLPIIHIKDGFSSCYLLFFLFIPFLNLLINAMSERMHSLMILLCLGIYTLWGSLLFVDIRFNYITWFCVIYIIGAYIRIYPKSWFDNKRLVGAFALISIFVSWLSVIAIDYVSHMLNRGLFFYSLVSDSNKILAVTTAIAAFLYFKNLNIRYSKFINTVAASTFGVLLIHANSAAMRRWLWQEVLNNAGWYNSNMLILHAVLSIVAVYAICTIIDYFRIKLIEKPLFRIYDKYFDF